MIRKERREERVACVVDASVGIKLFVAEPLSDEAHALFAHLTADPPARFFVPDLFYIECTNILWKYTRRMGMTTDEAEIFVEELGELMLQPTPTQALMTSALSIATTHNITAYDAAYVALSQRLALPLITADEKLVRALQGSPYTVHWLGVYSIPPLPTSQSEKP
jgi:predicted nucleic acid-binding protein